MAIHKYNTKGEYTADERASEANVSQITGSGEVIIDGNFVVTDNPQDGDALFLDPNNKKVWVKGGADLGTAPIGYKSVAPVCMRIGKKALVVSKEAQSNKYLALWQHAITAISATTIKFWLHMKGDYPTWTPIEVADVDGISATTVEKINTALEAAGNTGNVGYAKHGYWAFLANDDNEPVSSGATRIVVQCDLCEDYRQYQVSDSTHALVGCTMSLVVWEDMPSASSLKRKNGGSTTSGIQNVTRGLAYYSTNGATPSANVSPTDVSQIVKRVCFEDSTDAAYQYCAALREAYGTYENYIGFHTVLWPQKYGVFNLPDAKALTQKYGNKTAVKKDGTTIYKFPYLHWALNYGDDGNGGEKFDCDGLRKSDWFAAGVHEAEIFKDKDYTEGLATNAVKRKYNHTIAKMGGTQVLNNTSSWLAQRYYAYSSWFFGGPYGPLNYTNVCNALSCRAVALLDVDD